MTTTIHLMSAIALAVGWAGPPDATQEWQASTAQVVDGHCLSARELQEGFHSKEWNEPSEILACSRFIFQPDKGVAVFLNKDSKAPVLTVYGQDAGAKFNVGAIRFGRDPSIPLDFGVCRLLDNPEAKQRIFLCRLYRNGATAALTAAFLSDPG